MILPLASQRLDDALSLGARLGISNSRLLSARATGIGHSVCGGMAGGATRILATTIGARTLYDAVRGSGVERLSLPRTTPSVLAYRSIHVAFAGSGAPSHADVFGGTSADVCAPSADTADRRVTAVAMQGPIEIIRRTGSPGWQDVPLTGI